MSRQRDAGTGKYLSDEVADTRPRDTWVKETSKAKRQRNSKLGTVWRKLVERAAPITTVESDGSVRVITTAVTLQDINEVFEDAGLQLPNG